MSSANAFRVFLIASNCFIGLTYCDHFLPSHQSAFYIKRYNNIFNNLLDKRPSLFQIIWCFVFCSQITGSKELQILNIVSPDRLSETNSFTLFVYNNKGNAFPLRISYSLTVNRGIYNKVITSFKSI